MQNKLVSPLLKIWHIYTVFLLEILRKLLIISDKKNIYYSLTKYGRKGAIFEM